jgi:hypothetical protein
MNAAQKSVNDFTLMIFQQMKEPIRKLWSFQPMTEYLNDRA